MSINNQNTYLNIEDAHLRLRTGNVYAQGLNIGGITVDTAHGLQRVSDTGNVTSNTLQFANATTAFVTTANVTIGRDLTVTGNATVSSNLTVTGNAVISDDLTVTENLLVSNNLTVTGNTFYTNPAAVLVDSNVVTEYTGPHDRPLRKYPEVALTTTSETSSGYKGYKVSTSSQLTNYEGYHAFDKTGWETPASENNNAWVSGGSKYVAATGAPDTGAATTSYVGGTATGEYVQLQLPRKIKISKYDYTPRTHTGNDEGKGAPKTVKLLGSNNGSTWTLIKDITHLGTRPEEGVFYTAQVGATEYYDYIRFVATSTYSDGTSPTFTDVRLSQIRFYGHEEGSGSLDTTLKSVYNVPATTGTQLEVYYDGQDYSGVTSTVTDKVGTTTNATISNSGSTITFDSTYKAWTFGGSSGRTDTFRSSSLPSTFTGNQVHSITLWFNMSNISDGSIFVITPSGGENGGDVIMGQTQGDGARISYSFWGNDVSFDLPTNLATGSWYHLSMTYDATDNSTGRKMFLNGIECTAINTASGSLSLPNSNMIISFANRVSQTTYPFFGSIANFRLYSKALNADQVKELYDYQKDYFLGSKSQVTLYKGHLGVGVAEPSGQLELAGDERIQEYPPRALTGYETLVEGHGVFCASASTEFSASFPPYEAFNDSGSWITKSHYNTTTGQNGVYTGSVSTNGVAGEWLEMKSPYGIKISSFALGSFSDANSNRQPRNFVLFGSNDGNVWNQMKSVNNLTSGYTTGGTIKHNVNSTEYYTYFRVVVSATQDATDGLATITRLQFFGTPGPTTLDKGSLSLTRSLDVPRVSRYDVDTETPRPEKLVLDFDTTVNRSPTDISGKGNHGTMTAGFSYSVADKAFEGDSSTGGRRIEVTGVPTATGSGNFTHAVSMWFKLKTIPGSGTSRALWGMVGEDDGTDGSPSSYSAPHSVVNASGNISWAMWGNDLYNQTAVVANRWYHCVWTYSGGTTGRKMFLDGVEQTFNTSQTTALNMVNATSRLAIGIYPHDLATSALDGYVSNFKLYSVALEPSEVQKLYRLGRTGRSMVISDTAVGIGKVPEAQLDVRGILNVDGDIFLNGFKIFQPITPIARDGLAVLLDASDPNSYPASGNYFYDTSGNGRHGTAQGSVGWTSSGQQSYFNFPGANADYINQTSGSAFKFKDICIVFKFDSVAAWNYLISYNVTPDRSIRNYQGITYNGASAGDWAYPATTYYLDGVATTGNLTMVANKWYILGGAATNPDFTDNVRNYFLGTGGTTWSRNLDGKIAFVALYNRVLSADEQLQNYTALKRRFGV